MSASTYTNLRRVLVVDDTEDMRSLLREEVEELGLECIEAGDGEQATGVLGREPVDLLITDFRMPRMDGVRLLNWCRSQGVHIPVIFLSSAANLIPREEVALADCCATLMYKPMNREVFLATIGAADQRSHHRDCIHRRGSPVS